MGKKVKVGKQRRDKYYRLAKEAGLRSRAVFKLTQLNRKFEFLQKSHVLVDLCAAPGGWLQVASKFMPISSLIIGVDLASIRPMPNIITLQNDITTDSCRQEIKAQLQTWLADCVLHDGAPNVGKNWAHDAFMQAQLTLSALRLATEVLKRGGWFITKIFRSKDHPALVEVFKKLFKKVFVTKPEASRSESAEIYAVCRGYLKPDKVDANLLDPKCVFIDLNMEPEKPRINLMRPEKRKRKAEGYAENDHTLHHNLKVREFIETDKHLEVLAQANVISFDEENDVDITGHSSTTQEIRECCKDIKVLGRKELRDLLNWRKQIRQHLKSLQPKSLNEEKDGLEEADEVDEEVELDNYVSSLQAEEKRVIKKKRKKLMAEKRALKKKLDFKMVIPGDRPDYAEEGDLFNVRKIKNKEKSLGEMDVGSESEDLDDFDSDVDDENTKKQLDAVLDVDDDIKAKNAVDSWFKKDTFASLIGDEDEDADIERVLSSRKKLVGSSDENGNAAIKTFSSKPSTSAEPVADTVDDDDFSDDSDNENDDTLTSEQAHSTKRDHDFQVVPNHENLKLDAEGFALADVWIQSSKSRRNLFDLAYNRYANNDESLPDWFTNDERKHFKKELPISREAVEEYKRKLQEINARPIKKVAEAKARKKKRSVRRAEKAKKRAEAVIENSDMTEAQKSQEMRKIYKQASSNKKQEVKYVVAKKGQVGRRVHRPSGVHGRFKVVDPRMKKEVRAMRRTRSTGGRSKGGRSKGGQSTGGRSKGGQSTGGRSKGGRSKGGRSKSGRSKGSHSKGTKSRKR